MQFYFAHKQLLKNPVFYVTCWFLFMVFSSLLKESQDEMFNLII